MRSFGTTGKSGAFLDKFASDSLDVPLFFVFIPEPNCLLLTVMGVCASIGFAPRVRKHLPSTSVAYYST